MKTKLLITAIFLLSFLNSFSQEYYPFLNNSSWIIYDWVSCCRPPESRTIHEGTEVLIGDDAYMKFADPFPNYDTNSNPIDTIYIREDVAARKVYKIVGNNDELLYDFSLETGNTIMQYGHVFTATVDEIAVNNGNRKRITLNAVTSNGFDIHMIWIEGVGTVAHPFYPNRNMYNVMSSGGGYNINTKCSFQDGEHIYGIPACAALLETTGQAYLGPNIFFSPNPFVTELIVNSELAFQNAAFKLYNLQGQLVRQGNNLNGQKIMIGRENLNSGLYFIQLFENDKLIKSGKVLVD